MNLNKKEKDELKKKIEKQLQVVPVGQRIHLDRDLLESLLFAEIVVNREKGLILKMPIWSGEFLRKIDLSEVNFENVSWQVLGIGSLMIKFDGIEIDEDFYDRIDDVQSENGDYIVDYSYTNANIDLTTSFETINCGTINICNCNFEGVNLQSQDLSTIKLLYVYESNISDTKLVIPSNINLCAIDSDFSNLDLSSFTINGNISICGGDSIKEEAMNLSGCCLSNTGIKIEFDSSDYKKYIDYDSRSVVMEVSNGRNGYIYQIQEAFNKKWVGCYLNDKKIYTVEERKKLAHEKKAEYEKMKKDLISSVTSGIEQQVSGFSKK